MTQENHFPVSKKEYQNSDSPKDIDEDEKELEESSDSLTDLESSSQTQDLTVKSIGGSPIESDLSPLSSEFQLSQAISV